LSNIWFLNETCLVNTITPPNNGGNGAPPSNNTQTGTGPDHNLSPGAGGKAAFVMTIQTDFATRPSNFDAMAYTNLFQACCNSDAATYSLAMNIVSGSIIITAVITSNNPSIPALGKAQAIKTQVQNHNATVFDSNFIAFVAQASVAAPVNVTDDNSSDYDSSDWTTPDSVYVSPTTSTVAPTTTSSAVKITTAISALLLSSIAVLLL